ncbi:MAG: hypothetical protein ACLRWQ_07005 [Flavonifractor plautii]
MGELDPAGADLPGRLLPCALVISVPLSFFGGIGGASKHGNPGQGRQLSGGAGQGGISWSLTRPAR